jgi:transcriptional regulator with XRE-family HTH domain
MRRRPTQGKEFGKTLRAAREQSGVRLRELSEELGVSLPFLSDVENGRRSLSDLRIRRAAKFLKADTLSLLEAATKDRGRVVLETDKLDGRKLRVAMLLSMSWPKIPAETVSYLLATLES